MHYGNNMNIKVKFCFLLFLISTTSSWASNENKPLENCGLDVSQLTESRLMLKRMLGPESTKFCVQHIEKEDDKDVFSVGLTKGKVLLKGSSPVAIGSALNKFLRVTKQGHFSWGGDRLGVINVPSRLPAITVKSPVDIYYQFNFTAHGYTTPYWSWQDWERELDFMAFNGITHPLVIAGIEQVLVDTFTRFGYSELEIRDWLVLPAHLPWFLMGNMDSHGPALSRTLIQKRAKLGQKIVARMKSLGMTPVLPGYYGLVPRNFLDKTNFALTEQQVIQQGKWAGDYDRPALVDPNSLAFKQIAKSYYDEIKKTFGDVSYFAADPFHEGGKTAHIDVKQAAKNIQRAMVSANAQATWVLQAWQANPSSQILQSIDPKHALVIDLWGDEDPSWDRDGKDRPAFDGIPWAWLAIQNFGGNTGLTGNLDTIVEQFTNLGVFNDPVQSNLVGLGLAMEGIEQNPVVLDLMFDMRWGNYDKDNFNLGAWVVDYAQRRYGANNENAEQAWKLLLNTVYHSGPFRREGAIESVFAARPSWDVKSASTWGPAYGPYYNEQKLEQALQYLIKAGEQFSGQQTYLYDLADVARQVIANKGRKLLAKMQVAFEQKQLVQFQNLKDEFLVLMLAQSTVTQYIDAFTLKDWLDKAREFATSEQEAEVLVENAKRIVTTWAPINSNLQDYSHREWDELLSGYYYPRWVAWLNYQEAILKGTANTTLDLWHIENTWVNNSVTTSKQVTSDNLLEKVKKLLPNKAGGVIVPDH